MSMTQNGVLQKDDNDNPVMGGTSSSDNATIINAAFDPVTRRLLTDAASGSGTVTQIDTAAPLSGGPITTTGTITTSMATNKLIGRGTAGTGVMEEITLGTGLSLAGTTLNAAGLTTLTVGTTTITSGTTTRILYDNAGVLGEYTITGSGTVVAMQTNPTLSGLTMSDNTNIVLDTTTGTKIGTATTQKLAFYNSTPIVQPTGDVATALSNLGLVATPTVAATSVVVGTTTITSGTNTRILYDNAGTLGEYTITGSGTVVAMATAPTFVTSITTPSVLATANDSGALGASGTAFSDLFLASGAVINFNAGNVTLTHSAGILTQNAGELRITSANVGTNADSVPTLSSTSTLTNKTLTSPAITTGTYSGTQLLNEGAGIGLDPSLSADGTWSGITTTATAGYTQAFGDLVYLSVTDSRWELADADAASTAGPVALAMVVVAGTDGNSCTLLLQGVIRADAKFPTMTVGATQYVGETAGAIQGSIPTGADNIIRTVGYALTADALYFNPSNEWQVTVA